MPIYQEQFCLVYIRITCSIWYFIQNNLRTPQLAGFARQLGCKNSNFTGTLFIFVAHCLCSILISSHLILLDDFNIPDVNWSTLHASSSSSSTFYSLNLMQLINVPTHTMGNTLDLVFSNCNHPDLISNIQVRPTHIALLRTIISQGRSQTKWIARTQHGHTISCLLSYCK